jgi:hypothetical protein
MTIKDTGWSTVLNTEDPTDINSDIEIELEEESPSTETNLKLDMEKLEEEEVVEEPVKESKKEEEPVKEVEKQAEQDRKPSRAEKRIKELLEEKKAFEAKLKTLEEENLKHKKEVVSSNHKLAEEKKAAIEQDINFHKKALKEALESSDFEKAADIQVKLQQSIVDAKAIDAYIKTSKEIEEKPAEVKKEESKPASKEEYIDNLDASPPAKAFLRRSDWFFEDSTLQRNALTIAQDLIEEGYNDKSEEFYEELEQRVKQRFPKKFGKSDSDVVQLDKSSSGSGTENTPQKPSGSPENKQTVSSGGTRTPVADANKIILSPSERELARKLNLTDSQYAKEKKKLASKTINGYTDIL